ncbi:FAD-binding oxidoreductase [Rhodobacterales bacterium]|nr:FAD-binding oxidoreductase [Rhodobacterales bacterium]
MSGTVAIIGAGIVGVSTGIWLRRMGLDVTLIDRNDPGQGTSYGNAGVLAACSNIPVTTPGLIMKGPKLLLDPDFPLFLRWSYLPKLFPWLVRYLGHANDADTKRIAAGLSPIVSDTVLQHLSLTDGLSAAAFVRQSDYNFAYTDRAAFEGDAYVWNLRKETGFAPELIEGEAVREYDPAFGPSINLLASMKEHGYVLDPGGYVAALARDFEALGGKVMKAEVKDFALDGGSISSVLTSEGPVACDRVVLATGVWSAPLMKKLGLKIPLETERGYHIVFENPEGAPTAPAMVASGKFVATPMSAGLRCAGVVEFGGLEAGPSKAPLDLLRKKVKSAFPNLKYSGEESWLGHRPAPSDSLPLIGEISGSGVYAAFGHHHIGLTAGPKTGRLVAGLVANQPVNLDLSPYAPDRFSSM